MGDDNVIHYKGYDIRIVQDEFAENPREGECQSHMWFWHRRYELGDTTDTHNLLHKSDEPMLRQDIFKHVQEQTGLGIAYITPVSMLDHSGLWIWAGYPPHPSDPQGWDSGMIGYAFITTVEAEEMFGKIDRVDLHYLSEEVVLREIKEYNAYVSGEMCGYTITRDGEPVGDSCWGYADYKECEKDARAEVDALALQAEIKQWEELSERERYLAL